MKYALSNVSKMQNRAWHVLSSFGTHYMNKCMKRRRKRYSVEAAVTSPCIQHNFSMILYIINNFFSFVQDDQLSSSIIDCRFA